MRALALRQPKALLLAHGLQRTTTWKAGTAPTYTGLVALYAMPQHDGAYFRMPAERRAAVERLISAHAGERSGAALTWDRYVGGAVIGVACLEPAREIGQLLRLFAENSNPGETILSDFSDGRWLVPLDDARVFPEPVRCARPDRQLGDLTPEDAHRVAVAALALSKPLPSALRLEVERALHHLPDPPADPTTPAPHAPPSEPTR